MDGQTDSPVANTAVSICRRAVKITVRYNCSTSILFVEEVDITNGRSNEVDIALCADGAFTLMQASMATLD